MKLSEVIETKPRLKLSQVMGEQAPIQRQDRFALQSNQPGPYSYGDAIKDTGKTVINSLADLGENTINTIKSIPQIPGAIASAITHPIKTTGTVIQSAKNKIGEYNSSEKFANKVSTDPLGFASDVVGAGLMAEGGSKFIGIGPKTAAEIDSKVFNLYNESVGGKIRNAADVKTIKPQRVDAIKTISDNVANLKLKNLDTGEIVSRTPNNRLELLDSLRQTKSSVWKQVSDLSKGATDQNAKIDLPKIVDEAMADTHKKIGSVAINSNPSLSNSITATGESIKKVGQISPTQSEEYMKFLNGEVKRLEASGQAVDYSVKDLYSEILHKLNTATDTAIEKTLSQSGYKGLRGKYAALKSSEKEIIRAANKYLSDTAGKGGFVHPIVDLWSVENILEGAMGGGAGSLLRAGAIKSASKIVDYFRNPDKKIIEIFKILKKGSP